MRADMHTGDGTFGIEYRDPCTESPSASAFICVIGPCALLADNPVHGSLHLQLQPSIHPVTEGLGVA